MTLTLKKIHCLLHELTRFIILYRKQNNTTLEQKKAISTEKYNLFLQRGSWIEIRFLLYV